MKKSFLFALMMGLTLLLCSCRNNVNLFGEKVRVITATDMTIEDVVHVHETFEYAPNGMPERGSVSIEVLYENAEPVPDRIWTFSYDKEKGEIVTGGLYAVQGETGTQYVTQTLHYDPKGRLLTWQTPMMTAPVQYTYDADGHLTGITAAGSTTTISREYDSENWELTVPDILRSLMTVRYDQEGRISGWHKLDRSMIEGAGTSDVQGRNTYYEENGERYASFQIRSETEGEEESSRDYGYAYGTDSPDPKTARIGEDEEETGTWSFSYTYDGDRLLREERYLVSEEMEPQSVILTYEYDKEGNLTGLTQQSGSFSLTYSFAEVTVADPVIRSFLLTKPSILNGTSGLMDVSNSSLFVLTDDNQVSTGLDEHFCYHCGRLMPALITNCPYCGTEVNPVYYVKPDLWTLDGSLLK